MTKNELTSEQNKNKEMNTITPRFVEKAGEFIEAAKSFNEEFQDILAYVDVEDWEAAANITLEQMEEMSLRDVMELIRERHGVITPDSEIATKQSQHSFQLELELLDACSPINFLMAKSKVANTLINHDVTLNMGEFDVRNGNVVVSVSLSFDDEKIHIIEKDNKRFTPFDREVFNAVCSRYEAGNVTFTPDQIYRTMNGLDDGQYVSKESEQRIINSLEKMRFMEVKIDYTDEMIKRHGGDKLKKYVESEYMLPIKKAYLSTTRGNVDGYKLYGKPLVYSYSQLSQQILSVPIQILNTKDVINNTPEITVIRAHLIREIGWIKSEMKKPPKDRKRHNKINFDSIYEIIGYSLIGDDVPTKRKAQKVREQTSILLDKFKSEKYIKGFDLYKKGRSYEGVEIKV